MKDPKFWMKKEEDDGSELKLHDFYIVDFVFNVSCNVLGHKLWNLSPSKKASSWLKKVLLFCVFDLSRL